MLRVFFDLCDSSFAYFFSFSFHSWSTEMFRIRQDIDWNRKLILNLVSLMEIYSICEPGKKRKQEPVGCRL